MKNHGAYSNLLGTQLGARTIDDFGDGPQIDYEQSLFFRGPSSKTPETRK